MQIGLQLFIAGEAASSGFLRRVAPLLEVYGFHEIWLPEHIILFPQLTSAYPYSKDGKYPFDPRQLPLEPFTALSYLAAHTSTLRLAPGISVLPQRNPVFAAKQAADVDVLSDGRLDYGVGVGWCLEEIAALGVDPARRGARTDEYLQLMKTIWSQETIRHEGEFYSLPDCFSSPKPVQKPHPPLIIGGNSAAAMRRVARHGDGWFSASLPPAEYGAKLAELREACIREGRNFDDVTLVVGPPDGKADLEMVKEYAECGADQVVVGTLARDDEKFFARLERLAEELVQPAKNI